MNTDTQFEVNHEYKLLGAIISHLASIGATNKEIKKVFKKGPSLSILDICEAEDVCYRRALKRAEEDSNEQE